ncbi:MAG: hypothetical protein OEN50_11975, partial [Deltaproteobacteria bacterium]|nr:hypothetical protein [Deltaproteobacteria bacterium]
MGRCSISNFDLKKAMRRSAIAPIIALGLILVAARPAAGHAFLRRYDLPLPLWHYLLGAGLAVA